MDLFPNFEVAVVQLIAALTALAWLSVILVEINNQIIDMVKTPWHLFKRIIPILTSTTLLVVLSFLFPEAFPMTVAQAVFFGFVGGFVSKKLYDEGLFKKDRTPTLPTEGEL